MSDDKNETAQDRKLISLSEDYEVRSWMESLGVSEGELRLAVDEVGNSVDAVRAYLARQQNGDQAQATKPDYGSQ